MTAVLNLNHRSERQVLFDVKRCTSIYYVVLQLFHWTFIVCPQIIVVVEACSAPVIDLAAWLANRDTQQSSFLS